MSRFTSPTFIHEERDVTYLNSSTAIPIASISTAAGANVIKPVREFKESELAGEVVIGWLYDLYATKGILITEEQLPSLIFDIL